MERNWLITVATPKGNIHKRKRSNEEWRRIKGKYYSQFTEESGLRKELEGKLSEEKISLIEEEVKPPELRYWYEVNGDWGKNRRHINGEYIRLEKDGKIFVCCSQPVERKICLINRFIEISKKDVYDLLKQGFKVSHSRGITAFRPNYHKREKRISTVTPDITEKDIIQFCKLAELEYEWIVSGEDVWLKTPPIILPPLDLPDNELWLWENEVHSRWLEFLETGTITEPIPDRWKIRVVNEWEPILALVE